MYIHKLETQLDTHKWTHIIRSTQLHPNTKLDIYNFKHQIRHTHKVTHQYVGK